MRYPKFISAEYSAIVSPKRSRAEHYTLAALKYIFMLVLFVAVFFGLLHLTRIINSIPSESNLINIISVGASIVTFFSAIISVLSLFDATCMRKYEDSLQLLETRYLDEKKQSQWEFLNRCSYYSENDKKPYNYYIKSARYKLYYGNGDTQFREFTVPILAVDFHDLLCLPRIVEIRSIIPQYQSYLISEQEKYDGTDNSVKPPNYYIPLPQHIIALYKKIMEHRILKSLIALCSLFVICQVIVTIVCIVNYDVIFNVLSSQ